MAIGKISCNSPFSTVWCFIPTPDPNYLCIDSLSSLYISPAPILQRRHSTLSPVPTHESAVLEVFPSWDCLWGKTL